MKVIATWYGLTGVLNALWGATLAATDARLDLGAGRLGGVLLAVAAGALVAMPVAGRLADRGLLRYAGPAAALALAGPAAAPSVALLMISAVVLGLLFGTVNIALSVQAVAVERALDRPVMATMHGTWTLGAVAGGAAVAAGLGVGVDVQVLQATGAVALALAGLAIGRAPAVPRRVAVQPAVALRPGLVLTLGVIGAAAFVTEGAATDWAGVHATRVLGADPATASLVYTAFFVAMTVVRFVGDTARARLGARTTIGLAGGLATTGYGLVLLSGALPDSIGCAVTGWALAGAGMAVVWPVVVSSLGAVGARLSAVTMISYSGSLIGPAVIGLVAARATLPVALLIPAALAVVVTAVAPAVLGVLNQPRLRRSP